MSTAPQYTPHYTVDDYQLWEGDWELWNGVAVAMTPSPFGRHGTVLGRITTALTNAIDVAGCDANVIVEVDWIISTDTVVRPDLSVVCCLLSVANLRNSTSKTLQLLSWRFFYQGPVNETSHSRNNSMPTCRCPGT